MPEIGGYEKGKEYSLDYEDNHTRKPALFSARRFRSLTYTQEFPRQVREIVG